MSHREGGSIFHIFILFSLSVAWPLFEQLTQSPEFFIIRRSGAIDIIFLVLTLILIVPGLFVLSIWLLKRWNHRLAQIVHVFVLFLIFFCLFLIPVNRSWNFIWPVSLSICLTAACFIVIGYRRYSSIQTFIGFLAPALLIVPGVFLLNDSISKLILQKEVSFPQIEIASSTPVVFVVFDEFPLTSLLKDQLTIDENLYPNFAALAKTTTWYRNATTVSDLTSYAVPAILTGRFPRTLDLPIIYDHPSNLFTALGQSYDLIVFEEGERLLPAEFNRLKNKDIGLVSRLKSIFSDLTILYFHMVFPRGLRDQLLPPVDLTWGNFENDSSGAPRPAIDHASKFKIFVDSIEMRRRPTLFYLHSMLPHAPWDYLPSGRIERCRPGPEVLGYKGMLECHLLTVGFVDRLIGKLIERLKETGVYDRCLLIITADHGAGFRVGPARRAARKDNFRDIMVIPLFVKVPYQKHGEVNDLNVSTIDLLPTVADVLDVQFPWVEGVSIFDRSIKERSSKQFFSGVKHKMTELEHLIRPDPQTLAAQELIVRSNRFQLAFKR